jgi:hypothetical protein
VPNDSHSPSDLPTRAELSNLSLFGLTAEERELARALRDLLYPGASRDPTNAETENWLWQQEHQEEIDASEEGRFIKEIVDARPVEIFPQAEDEETAEAVDGAPHDSVHIPEPPPAVVEEPPQPVKREDGINPVLKRLQLPNQEQLAREREDSHRAKQFQADQNPRLWVAARPSPETRGDQQPLY